MRDLTDGFFVALLEKGSLKDTSSLQGVHSLKGASLKETGSKEEIAKSDMHNGKEVKGKRKFQDGDASKQSKKWKNTVKEEVKGLLVEDSTLECATRDGSQTVEGEAIEHPRSKGEVVLDGEEALEACIGDGLLSEQARQSLLRRRKAKRARKKERSRQSIGQSW